MTEMPDKTYDATRLREAHGATTVASATTDPLEVLMQELSKPVSPGLYHQSYGGRAQRDPLTAVRAAIDAEYARWGESVAPQAQGARTACAHIAAALLGADQ